MAKAASKNIRNATRRTGASDPIFAAITAHRFAIRAFDEATAHANRLFAEHLARVGRVMPKVTVGYVDGAMPIKAGSHEEIDRVFDMREKARIACENDADLADLKLARENAHRRLATALENAAAREKTPEILAADEAAKLLAAEADAAMNVLLEVAPTTVRGALALVRHVADRYENWSSAEDDELKLLRGAAHQLRKLAA